MRFSWPAKSHQQQGFTLVELMVIAPIAILAIAGMIVLMMAIVGNVMVTHDENKIMHDSHAALDTIERDTRLSAQFLSATTGVQSPQGVGSNFAGSGNFTNGNNTLILTMLATTKNPRDTTRQLVYYANQPSPCSGLTTQNQLYAVTVVYFIKDGSLWRRTIAPPHNQSTPVNSNTTCATPWQLNSCSPGQTATRCATEDAQLLRDVSSMTIQYFSEPSSTTPLSNAQAPNASTIKLTLNVAKKTAGRDLSSSQVLVVNKMNLATTGIGPQP